MTRYKISEIIGICDVMDDNLDKIQKEIQEFSDQCRDEKVKNKLIGINVRLDGLGVDIDTMKEKLKELI